MNKLIRLFILIIISLIIIPFNPDSALAKDADGDYVILIDPGHGSTDCGAISLNGDYESDVNFHIAMGLKAKLSTYEGVKVYLTRGYGEYQSNTARAFMGKNINADLNISLHNNSSTVSYAKGIVVYGTVDSRYKNQMYQLAKSISGEVHKLGLDYHKNGYDYRTGTYNSARDYYTFLEVSSLCNIPSIIIEHSFFSNASDSLFMHSVTNRYKVGEADAIGIAKYLNLSPRTVNTNSKLTLTRTYSALINAPEGTTFSSSDSSIAYVDETGLITALKQGSATITCTNGGSTSTIEVNVPAVTLQQITAGLVQRCYRNFNEARNYNKDCIILKAIYSDGSAVQITKGYTVGQAVEGTVIDKGTANQMTMVNVPIQYNNYSCTMTFFHYYHTAGQKNRISTPLESTVKPIKNNIDIALTPSTFAVGSYIPTPPVEDETTKATENATKPSEQSTTTPTQATTKDNENSTTEASGQVATEISSTDSTNSTTSNPASSTTGKAGFDINTLIAIVTIIALSGVVIFVTIRILKK